MESKKLIEIASSRKPHGIKGALSLHLYNDESRTLKEGLEIILRPMGEESSLDYDEVYKVKSISYGNKPFVYLYGVDDRNIVEDILPVSIHIKECDLPLKEEGEFYLYELIGLDVVNEKGKAVGVIDGHFDNGAQPVLKIKLNNGGILELPFVDNFFPEIDLENKKVVMITPKEL
jgi:16S rRNA processing protein RimM